MRKTAERLRQAQEDKADLLDALTPREREFVGLVADEGLSVRQIAERTCVAVSTAKNRKYNVLRHLDCADPNGLVRLLCDQAFYEGFARGYRQGQRDTA